MPDRARPRRGTTLGAPLAWYLLCAAAVAGPALPDLARRFLGHPESDVWKHLWGMWWFRHSLADRKTLPLYCFDLNFPDGGYLYFADPLNALLSLPLQAVLPLPLTYNLLVLGQLVLGALGAFVLVRQVTGSRAGALVGGTVYAFSPIVLAYSLGSGVTETLHVAWLPLHLAALLRLLERPGDRGVLVAGAATFALAAFGSWYYGLFLALLEAVVLAGWSWANRPPVRFLRWSPGGGLPLPGLGARGRRAWRSLFEGWRDAAGRQVLAVFLMALLAGLMVLPYLVAFKMVLASDHNLVSPKGSRERSGRTFESYLGGSGLWSLNEQGQRGHFNEATLAGLVLPGKDRAVVTVSIDRLTRVHYLGYALLGLAALGAWAFRPGRAAGPAEGGRPRRLPGGTWTAAFLLFAGLALGPTVHLSHEPESLQFPNLLYLLVYVGFPFFDQVAHPFRLLVPAFLAGAVLAGQGVAWLATRLPSAARAGLATGLSALVLAEILVVSPLPWPLPTAPAALPDVYGAMAADGANYAILDLPVERPGTILVPGEYFYYQAIHEKRIPYRTSGVLSDGLTATIFHKSLQTLLGEVAPSPLQPRVEPRIRRLSPEKGLARGADELRTLGFVYVVVHRKGFTPPQEHALVAALEKAFGEPAFSDLEVVAFRLQAPRDLDEFQVPQPKVNPGPPPPPPPPGAGP